MSLLSMASLSRLKQISSDALKVYEGRDRYKRAAAVILEMEKIYRRAINDDYDPPEDLSWAHGKAAAVLADLCRSNGGIWVKFAQYLSCRADLLPKEFIQALQQLQWQGKAKPFYEVVHRFEGAWGAEWEAKFDAFDLVPVASASIAQVYKAKLRHGPWVAVKVLIPGIKLAFEQDVLVFRTVAKLISPLVKEVDVVEICDHLVQATLGELSFNREIANIELFQSFEHPSFVSTPQIFDELSGDSILVTQWVDGTLLTQLLKRKIDTNREILQQLLVSMAQQIFKFGVFHADPHPGNLLIVQEKDNPARLVFLDFGLVARLTATQQQSFLAILLALASDGAFNQLPGLFEKAGFSGVEPTIFDEIKAYVSQRDNRRSDKLDSRLDKRLEDILQQLRKHRVVMPPAFIDLARVLMILMGIAGGYDIKMTDILTQAMGA